MNTVNAQIETLALGTVHVNSIAVHHESPDYLHLAAVSSTVCARIVSAHRKIRRTRRRERISRPWQERGAVAGHVPRRARAVLPPSYLRIRISLEPYLPHLLRSDNLFGESSRFTKT